MRIGSRRDERADGGEMSGGETTDLQRWVGRTMAEVCGELGNPDRAEPASIFGVKLRDAVPSVALTYRGLGHVWLVSEEAVVVAVVRIKE